MPICGWHGYDTKAFCNSRFFTFFFVDHHLSVHVTLHRRVVLAAFRRMARFIADTVFQRKCIRSSRCFGCSFRHCEHNAAKKDCLRK